MILTPKHLVFMELSKSRLATYSQLSRRKMRERYGLFIVEGYKSVEDTITSFDVEALITLNGIKIPDSWHVEDCHFEVSEGGMKKLSGLSTPSEMIAVYRIPGGFYDRNIKPVSSKLYLLLDGIQDPGNLGTIIRTAHWFGIDRIYASHDTVDIFNPKTIQSTMGSLGKVDIIYCDLTAVINENPGMPVYGTLLDGKNIYEAKLSEHGFILMGNEGKGISEQLRPLITNALLIPPANTANHPESLNVAIATAVTLSQFRNQLS